MDAQQFLAEFGHIASAPEGINRLRELILQLAISGKLVEASTDKDTVPNALALASQLRSEYETKFELRAIRPHPPVDCAPYPIPSHWQWERLEQITLYIQRGKGPTYVEKSNTFVVSQKCVQWSGFDLSPARYVAEDSLKTYGKERFLQEGDLLWNSTGTGTAGRITIYDLSEEIRAVADSHVTVIRLAKFLPRYIWCVIASPWVQLRIIPGHVESLVSGTTQQVELATSTVRALPIPCPPIEEQARIVAKVDELMVLCDKLEAQQQERQKLKKLVRATTLDAFVTATNSADLKQSWLRLEKGLEFWGDDEQTPFEIRNAIGAIACRGLLTDSGALQPVTNDDSLPPLPEGWRWRTLGELSIHITSGSRGWKQYLATTGEIFIRSQDIKRDEVVLENPAYVLLPEKSEGKRTLVQPGDLLLTITGGNVGKCAQVPDLPKPAYVSQHVALIRVEDPESSPFIHFWMTNIHGGRKFLGRYIYGDKPGLNLAQVASVPVPMPPKAIQAQIAGSLEHYTTICNRLLQQVTEAKEIARLLATAAVTTITGNSQ